MIINRNHTSNNKNAENFLYSTVNFNCIMLAYIPTLFQHGGLIG